MATDVEKLDFQIGATDRASAVIRNVGKTFGDLEAQYTRFAALAGTALVATGLISIAREAIATRSALDDLADTTGDAVRTLDGLRRHAEISGVAFDQVGGALTKFARNLDAADDDGRAAAAAISSIGMSLEELQALKPGEALFEVARALGKFEDGAGKVRVAVALMGRSGAEMLPYLKDLAESGELNGRITDEQAAAAEKLERQWRGLLQVFRDGRDAIASLLIPELTKKIGEFQEGIRIFGGPGSALYNIGFAIDPTKNIGENMAAVRKQIEEVQRMTRTPMGRARQEQLWVLGPTEDTLRKRLEFLQYMERERALAGAGDSNLDARDLAARAKPLLAFTPPAKGGGNREGNREGNRDVDSLIRSLQEEEIKKNAVLRVTEVLGLLETERYQNATAAERALAVEMAGRIDLQHVDAESTKSAIEEEARAWQIIIAENERQIKEENDRRLALERHMNKQAQHWRDIADPMEKYRRELVDIAELEAMMYLSAEQAAAAREYVYAGIRRELGVTAEKTKETDDWARQMGLTFNSAFEDAIVRGNDFRAVLSAIGQDIAMIMLRKSVTEPLGSAASSFFGNVFGNLFGGGASNTTSQQPYQFANGGDFTVGGSGGTDSQLVQFLATPGEMVSVRTPGQAAGGGTYYIDARGADPAGLARVEAMILALNGSIERRAVSAVMDAKMRGGAAARVLA